MTHNNWQQINHNWDNQGYSNHPYNAYHRVSLEEAILIAKDRVPGEVVIAELDSENGLFVYEIEIRDTQGIDYELEIDVYTGQIVKLKAG